MFHRAKASVRTILFSGHRKLARRPQGSTDRGNAVGYLRRRACFRFGVFRVAGRLRETVFRLTRARRGADLGLDLGLAFARGRPTADFERALDAFFLAALAPGRLGLITLVGRAGVSLAGSSVSLVGAGGAGSSDQPCASRTATMVFKMSFQVSGCIMTLLGNMQPSQQIWRTARVGFPSLVLSQKPAWRATDSFPFGSPGRQ